MVCTMANPNKWLNAKSLIAAIAALLFVAIVAAVWYFIFGNATMVTRTKLVNISNAPVQHKTIRIIGQWKGEDKREDFLAETLKEFITRNPWDSVQLKWSPDFPGGRAGAIQAMIDQLKTGKIDWDVIWLEPAIYQRIAAALGDQNWAKRYLVDFETVPGFYDTQKPFILSDRQYRDQMNGMITGPYIEGFYQPLFYNKELADMIGIKVKDQGMTFDDLLGYFAQVNEYNKAHKTNIPILYDSGDHQGGIGYAASTWNIFQRLFQSRFASLSEVEDLSPSATKLAAVKQTLASLEQLGKFKPLIPGWKDLDWYGTRSYVLDDKAVFTACGASWLYSDWAGLDPKKTMKMVPVEMPAYQPIDYYMGGYNPIFAVVKDSPVRDEAVKLLMSFTTPNVSEKWVRYAKALSGVKGNISAAGSISSQPDQFDDFITSITNKYGSNIFDSATVDYILGDKYKGLTLKFAMHLGDVMDGKASADEAYAAILKDMNEVDGNIK